LEAHAEAKHTGVEVSAVIAVIAKGDVIAVGAARLGVAGVGGADVSIVTAQHLADTLTGHAVVSGRARVGVITGGALWRWSRRTPARLWHTDALSAWFAVVPLTGDDRALFDHAAISLTAERAVAQVTVIKLSAVSV